MVHSSKYMILRDLDLFKSLSDQQLEQIAYQAEYKRFKKGQFIFQPGDAVTDIYILNKGSLKSGVKTVENKTLIKEIVYQKELLGENVMTDAKVRRAFAQTVTDCELFALPAAFFKDLLQKNPQLCQELTYILISKISNLEKRMSNFVFKKAQNRITEFIRDLAERKGMKIGMDEILVNHGLSHKEIANITDTSRQTVARVLGDLKRQNIIHFSARKPHKILVRNIMSLS